MAWTTPPTFSNGDILTAAKLNILSDDLAFLEGRGNSPSIPFMVYKFSISVNLTYMVRHKYRYLHWQYVNPGANAHDSQTRMRILYNNTEVHNQAPVAFLTTYTGSADLNILSLTKGGYYTVEVQFTKDTYEPGVLLRYLEERDSA